MSISTDHGVVPEWDMADRLNKSLRVAKMSAQQMADHLEVHRNTVSSWLNGRGTPKKPQLIAWALRVGLPFEWLRDGTEPEQPDGPDGGGNVLLPRMDSNHQPPDCLVISLPSSDDAIDQQAA